MYIICIYIHIYISYPIFMVFLLRGVKLSYQFEKRPSLSRLCRNSDGELEVFVAEPGVRDGH